MASFSQIANNLQISPPTAKSRYKKLISGDPKTIYGVSAYPNLSKLGLEVQTFKLTFETNHQQEVYRIIEKIADTHPYTSYYNRCFGGKENGMFMQFSAPALSFGKLDKLVDKLKNYIDFKSIIHFDKPQIEISTFPNLNAWTGRNWDFRFQDWYKNSEILSSSNIPENHETISKLTLVDVILIRELMINSRRKKVQIRDDINRSSVYSVVEKGYFREKMRKSISRHLAYINSQKLVQHYRLRYDRNLFGMNTQIVLFGQLTNQKSKTLIQKLKSNPIPLRSTFRTFEKNKFYWWINCPLQQTFDLSNFMMNVAENFEIVFLDTNISNSKTYPIWHRNFEGEHNHSFWKDSVDWMIYNPLEISLK